MARETISIWDGVWEWNTDGWCVHSGATGRYSWWIARYVDGVQVDVLSTGRGNTRTFATLERAHEIADKLNRRDGVQGYPW